MPRWTLIPLATAVLGLSACNGGTGATAAGPTASPPQVLLDAAQVPGGPWKIDRTGTVRWADLEEALVPCGQRVIAPDEAQVRFRIFESPAGAWVSEIVVSGVDTMQTFKRFYAECLAVGDVSSEPGPRHVAHLENKVEIAAFTADHLIVTSGPVAAEDLNQIADAAKTQVAQAGE